MKELDKLIAYLENLYKNLPSLPKEIKDFIVVVTPWLALVFGVLGVLGSLAAIGMTTFVSPFLVSSGGAGTAAGLTLTVVLAFITSVLMVVAVPSLLNRKIMGWKLLFLNEVLGLLSAVVTISFIGVIFTLLWFYLLFQIKSYYK